MAAFIWSANPDKWVATALNKDSWESLRVYISDPSAYVYWSTPQLKYEIRIGDTAFIWRTKNKKGGDGIVAVGIVEEQPTELTAYSHSLFSQPDRLAASGWVERDAPSPWKTGIRIQRTFWSGPINPGMIAPRHAVWKPEPDNLTKINDTLSRVAKR